MIISILASCTVLFINSAGYFEVPVVSIPCYTCPTISHPKPNYPYDFTVDQVVQQLSLVETMLRKKIYVRWCVWKKSFHPQNHDVMSSNVDAVSLLTCCDHCVCFLMLDTFASWPPSFTKLGWNRIRSHWKDTFGTLHQTKVSSAFGGVFSSIGRS